MNVDKSNILDKIIKKVDCIIEKMDKKFYKKWTSKRNQKNILNVLNDVDFNDCVYIENKNNYLICEFEKCPDIQKNELIKEFEKLLPLTQRQKRERVKNGISEKEPHIEVKKKTNKFLEFCKENRNLVKRDIPNIKPREVYSELARRWKDYRFVEASRRDDCTEPDTKGVVGDREEASALAVTQCTSKRNAEGNGPLPEAVTAERPPPSDRESARPVPGSQVTEGGGGLKVSDDCKVKKRRLSGYIIFCNENRPVVKQKFPNMKPQKVMKELAKQWRNLNDETRAIYNYEATAKPRADSPNT